MKKSFERRPSARIRQLALVATAAELRDFELVRSFYRRKSDSDTLRFLITDAAEKILAKNTPSGVNQEAQHGGD